MQNMNEHEFEISPEAQEQLRQLVEKVTKMAQEFCDAFAEIVSKVMEEIRKIAINLARFFLKMQLLEWRVPLKIADYVSEKIYWYWAVRIGFAYLQRKLLL